MTLSMIDRSQVKASLERYREASMDVMAIIAEFVTDAAACLERASIDEAYVDLTTAAQAAVRHAKRQTAGSSVSMSPSSSSQSVGQLVKEAKRLSRIQGQVVIVTHNDDNEQGDRLQKTADMDTSAVEVIDESNDSHLRLCAGALICADIRAAVKKRLGLTLSAGVATSKVLSKLASSMNKPDLQTIVTLEQGVVLLQSLPIVRIPGFGGKHGLQLTQRLARLRRSNPKQQQSSQHYVVRSTDTVRGDQQGTYGTFILYLLDSAWMKPSCHVFLAVQLLAAFLASMLQ
jgi:DNA polymerase eta